MAEPVSKPIVKGSKGFPLVVDTEFTLTGYTTLALRFWKPDGTEATKITTGVDDNGDPDGTKVRWVAVTDGYFDVTEEWKVVAEVTHDTAIRYSEPPGRIPVVEAGQN